MKRKKYTQNQRIALTEKIISQLYVALEQLKLKVEQLEKKQNNE